MDNKSIIENRNQKYVELKKKFNIAIEIIELIVFNFII